MFKKRPRAGRHLIGETRPSGSKMEAKYWRERLFKNTFTYQNRRCEVSNWSVKIQHQGIRKTFSLRANSRAQAAGEACQLYKTIISHGWENVTLATDRSRRGLKAASKGSGPNGFDADDWAQRLIHRDYRDLSHPQGTRELSVRVEHEGTNYYFPLGTDDRKLAAQRAWQIHETVARSGWTTANERFRRELSVAFRWVESPVAWTYTTLHTRTLAAPTETAADGRAPTGALNVAITESDAGIARALSAAITKMVGFHCAATFSRGTQALERITEHPIHLVLVSQSLVDQPGSVCLAGLKAAAPKVTGVLFSVFEDSDRLFGSSPGGAASYLFRRTTLARVLEPLIEASERGILSHDEIANSVRHYFERTVATLSVGGSANELTSLTERERQVLALLTKGHPDKEIGDLLRISTWTVHGHLKKIFEKLGVHNRTEAVVRYLHK